MKNNYTKATALLIRMFTGLENPSHEEAIDMVLSKLVPVDRGLDALGSHAREKIRLIGVLDDNKLVLKAMHRSNKLYQSKNEFYAEFGFTDSKDYSRYWRAERVVGAIEELGQNAPRTIDWLEPLAPYVGTADFKPKVNAIIEMGWSKKNVLLAIGHAQREHPVVKILRGQLTDLDKALYHLSPDHPAHSFVLRVLRHAQATIELKSKGASGCQRVFPEFGDDNFSESKNEKDLSMGTCVQKKVPPLGNHQAKSLTQFEAKKTFGVSGSEGVIQQDDNSVADLMPSIFENVAPPVSAAIVPAWPEFLKPCKYLQAKSILRLQFRGQGSASESRKNILGGKVEMGGLGFTYISTRFAWERIVQIEQVDLVVQAVSATFQKHAEASL